MERSARGKLKTNRSVILVANHINVYSLSLSLSLSSQLPRQEDKEEEERHKERANRRQHDSGGLFVGNALHRKQRG